MGHVAAPVRRRRGAGRRFTREELTGRFGARDPALDETSVADQLGSAVRRVVIAAGVAGLLFLGIVALVVTRVVRARRRRRPFAAAGWPPQWPAAGDGQRWSPAGAAPVPVAGAAPWWQPEPQQQPPAPAPGGHQWQPGSPDRPWPPQWPPQWPPVPQDPPPPE